MPTLRWWQGVARADAAGMCRLWVSDVGDRRDDIPRYADPFGGLVSGDVVGDNAEERRQRSRTAAGVGLEELRDGLDVAA